jgi:ethanolaminephosphotransferase
MTFLGFLLLVVNFLLFSYYDFHFTEAFAIPGWVWLVAAICQFASHQLGMIEKQRFQLIKNYLLDGMDGKQARRTKSSSALGELFDHGVDSWASFLFPVCIFSALSRMDDGLSPMAMHLLLISIYITFIDSHWEKYNTKVLFLPWSYDISMLVRRIMISVVVFCFQFIFI